MAQKLWEEGPEELLVTPVSRTRTRVWLTLKGNHTNKLVRKFQSLSETGQSGGGYRGEDEEEAGYPDELLSSVL